MKFKSDIDIDVANRDQALTVLAHTNASIIREDKNTKHNTGVYFTEIPVDPYTCLLYTSPSPRDRQKSRMPSSA